MGPVPQPDRQEQTNLLCEWGGGKGEEGRGRREGGRGKVEEGKGGVF